MMPASKTADAGYTLTEVMVAAVVLITGLAVAISTVFLVAADPVPQRHVEALQRAETALSVTLAASPGFWQSDTDQEGPWTIVRRIDRQAGVVTVAVGVFYGDGSEPLVELVGARMTAQDP